MAVDEKDTRHKMPFFSVRRKWKALEYTFETALAVFLSMGGVLAVKAVRNHSAEGFIPWAVDYAWGLAFAALILVALALPLWVRKLGVKLVPHPSLFHKQILLYWATGLIPVSLLAFFFLAAAWAQGSGISWLPSAGLAWGLAGGFLALTAWAFYCAVRDFNRRVNDALLVITNGMEMAAKLDFDAPIVAPSQDEIGLVSEFFNQATHMLKARVHVLQALFNNVRIFSGLLDEERLLAQTLKTFKNLEKVEEIVIALRDEKTGEMVVRKSHSGREEIQGWRVSPGEGVFGSLLKNPELAVYTEEEYGGIFQKSEKEKKLWGKSAVVMAVPLIYKGMLTGAVAFYNIVVADQLQMKKDYIQGLCNQIAIYLENARLYQMVIRDRLTGLYVHNFIEAELGNLLAQARRYQFPVSFLMFDVDKFKGINDQYGHPAGNQLLMAVAQAMRSISRDSDLPARYGGDEFEIVLPHTDKEGGRIYAEKLRAAVEASELELAPGVKAHVTISVGLATYPQDAETAAQLQAAADNALYGAKALGRNCIVMYQSKDAAPEGRTNPS